MSCTPQGLQCLHQRPQAPIVQRVTHRLLEPSDARHGLGDGENELDAVQRIANDLLKLGAKHLDAHVANEALTETCRHEGQVQTH